jgi:hypothetical protein
MALGLRFDTKSLTLGTTFSFFVPGQDMPDEPNKRGHELFEDENTTPFGNTFLYEKGMQKQMHLSWKDIHVETKQAIDWCVKGWFGQRQLTIISYGSSVINDSISLGSLGSVGQVYGTGFLRYVSIPEEKSLDLWDFETVWKEFGTNQYAT